MSGRGYDQDDCFRGYHTICSKLLGWTAPRHQVPELGL